MSTREAERISLVDNGSVTKGCPAVFWSQEQINDGLSPIFSFCDTLTVLDRSLADPLIDFLRARLLTCVHHSRDGEPTFRNSNSPGINFSAMLVGRLVASQIKIGKCFKTKKFSEKVRSVARKGGSSSLASIRLRDLSHRTCMIVSI